MQTPLCLWCNPTDRRLLSAHYRRRSSGKFVIWPRFAGFLEMPIPAWAVSAAILLDHKDGLSIQDLTQFVVKSGLSRLGRKVRKVETYKILWSQLTRNCPHPDWFDAWRQWIRLAQPDNATADSMVRMAMNAMTALRLKKMPPLAEEMETPESLKEGAVKTITVNAFERNPQARRECIKYHGAKCSACGIDFADRYGECARDFIHVHHLRPLSTIGHDYVIDPIEDLRPICPNCHAVIHLDGKCRTIEEIKRLLAAAYGR
jgi:hypothetical protein